MSIICVNQTSGTKRRTQMSGFSNTEVIYTDRHHNGTGKTTHRDEVSHFYGQDVHLMWDPLALSWLARLCSPECHQPELGTLTRQLYKRLIHEVIARTFPTTLVRSLTRMAQFHPDEGYYRGVVLDHNTKVTTVNVARAGTMPSQVCYEALCKVLDPSGVCQDNLMMQRTTDQQHRVTGADISGLKFSGRGVENNIIIFPDPMGATGSSLDRAIKLYTGDTVPGVPSRVITLHLVVTPEFIRRMTKECPGTEVWAWRLDRGLSTHRALASIPGTYPDEERGLNDQQYIVPGAGGMGELLNNALE